MTSDDLIEKGRAYIEQQEFEMAARVFELLAEECRRIAKKGDSE